MYCGQSGNDMLFLLQDAPSGESSTEKPSVTNHVKIKLCKVLLGFGFGSLCWWLAVLVSLSLLCFSHLTLSLVM